MANQPTDSWEGDPELSSRVKGNGIHIGNVGGDVVGVGVNGSGNIIGKNIIIGSLSVDDQLLQQIPQKYADSLKLFTDTLNQQFKANNVPPDKVADVQKNVNEFSKELVGIDAGQDLGIIKKSNLKSKLINIAKAALTILPKTLPVVLSAFTPLQPFSQLIGEDTQVLVQAVQKEI